MEDRNFFKTSKKTIYRVIVFHIFLIMLMLVPFHRLKKNKKTKLVVNEVFIKKQIEKKIEPKKTFVKSNIKKPSLQQPTNKSSQKKPSISKSKTFEKPKISNELIQKLESQINFLNEKKVDFKKDNLLIPKKIKIEPSFKDVTISNDTDLKFKELVIQELKKNLNLLEFGEVKASFTILPSGKVTDVVILDSKSKKNENYLKNTLLGIELGIKSDIKKEQKFIVTFTNE
jgi:outer membrane biosynthesis protein TonB